MRREELINGVIQIQVAINKSDIILALRTAIDRRKASRPEFLTVILPSLYQFAKSAASFNPAAREIADILGINSVVDPRNWAKFIGSDDSDRSLYRDHGNLLFAANHLPKILNLIRQQPLAEIERSIQDASSEYAGMDLINVTVLEENGRLSNPRRIILMLESIQALYEACATIAGMSEDSISVVACDSGSDKSFDFLGLAKVVEGVKEIILSLWDNIVYRREYQMSQRLDLVAQALPVIDEIATLQQDGKIAREEAEILKRKITTGVSKFIESGAMIPEMQERSQVDVRVLMAPEPMLLAPPVPDAPSQESVTEDDSVENDDHETLDLSDLNDEQRKEVLRLLKDVRQQKDSNSIDSVEESDN